MPECAGTITYRLITCSCVFFFFCPLFGLTGKIQTQIEVPDLSYVLRYCLKLKSPCMIFCEILYRVIQSLYGLILLDLLDISWCQPLTRGV